MNQGANSSLDYEPEYYMVELQVESTLRVKVDVSSMNNSSLRGGMSQGMRYMQ